MRLIAPKDNSIKTDGVPSRRQLGAKLRFFVLRRDGFACRYCGASAPATVLHVDHIVPVSDGGPNVSQNLITACSPCNLGKGNQHLPNDPFLASDRPGAAALNLIMLASGERPSPIEADTVDDFFLGAMEPSRLYAAIKRGRSAADAIDAMYRIEGFPA